VVSFASLVAASPARLAFHEASSGRIFWLIYMEYWQVWLVPLLWFIQVHIMDQQMVMHY